MIINKQKNVIQIVIRPFEIRLIIILFHFSRTKPLASRYINLQQVSQAFSHYSTFIIVHQYIYKYNMLQETSTYFNIIGFVFC